MNTVYTCNDYKKYLYIILFANDAFFHSSLCSILIMSNLCSHMKALLKDTKFNIFDARI